MAAERSNYRGQAWFCTTRLPSDVIIEVDDMVFHLHKFPLMSKSKKLQELIEEQEKILSVGEDGCEEITEENDGSREEDKCYINLPDFPGGSAPFEAASKFCYGQKIDISASNAAALRCAAEYLEMTEEHSDDNLISMTERFISQSVLRSIKTSLISYASCQQLLPMAENLGIVARCLEAIATKASAADLSGFGWPLNEDTFGNGKGKRGKLISEKRGGAAGVNSWLDELGRLNLLFFKRLIFAMKDLNLSGDVIEVCLIHYARKYIPGISRSGRKTTASTVTPPPSEQEQRDLLETIIANFPDKTIRSNGNLTRFMFGLLRTAYILKASESSRFTVERKIGSHLEHATLDDLLIPSYSYLTETLYDVDCVERILTHYLDEREGQFSAREEDNNARSAALMMVGKLIDGYLSEIASDANLKPDKFFNLATALPYHARIFDDGLYRAIDVYLKAHPSISEAEREKICGVLDYQKLTLEACTHAAQNERLPLRSVVQVLFFEQLQLRHAIAGNILTADASEASRTPSTDITEEGGNTKAVGELAWVPHAGNTNSGAWRVSEVDSNNHVLRGDMDSMRTRVYQLERECSSMRKAIESMGPREHVERNGWMGRFGCKIKPQVCNSHDRTAVEARKGRGHRHDR